MRPKTRPGKWKKERRLGRNEGKMRSPRMKMGPQTGSHGQEMNGLAGAGCPGHRLVWGEFG